MKWHLKRVVSFVLLTGSAWTSSCFAQHGWSQNGYCQQPTMCCAPCPNIAFHADLLYWRAHGSNIVIDSEVRQKGDVEFVDEMDIASFNFESQFGTKKKSLDFDWDLGFRLGLAIQKPCSCWALLVDWTHLNTHADGHESPCGSKSCGKFFSNKYEIDADWVLNLDFYDFVLAKRMDCSCCLVVTPFLGVRLARVHQKFSSEQEAEFNFSEVDLAEGMTKAPFQGNKLDVFTHVSVKEKHKFNGAGPRLGVHFDYCMGCGLALVGLAAINGEVGYTDHRVLDCLERDFDFANGIQSAFVRQFVPVEENTSVFERDESLQANRWIADFGVGVVWNALCNSCCNITFKFAWEYHAIFNQKHAHFGQDFAIPYLESSTELFKGDGSFDNSFAGAGPRRPFYTGTCRSTLGVQGFVFSTIICF